jgi:hypothetical protein
MKAPPLSGGAAMGPESGPTSRRLGRRLLDDEVLKADGFKCTSGCAHGDLISSRSADAASVPKRPSIDKKDQSAPGYDQQRRFDRFNDAVAFKAAFDRPDDADDDDEDPPVPSYQVEQSELWVHLRALESAPPERGSRGI